MKNNVLSKEQIQSLIDFLEHENRWIMVEELSYLTDMPKKDLFLAAILSEGRVIIDIDNFKASKCAPEKEWQWVLRSE